MEDQRADAAAGAWNPLTATGTSLAEARRLCDDALRGIRLALREVEFADAGLAHRLLVHELRTSVDRAFGTTACGHTGDHAAVNSGGGFGPAPQGYDAPGAGSPYGGGSPYGAGNPYAPGAPYAPGSPGTPPPMGPGGPGGPGGGGGGGLPPQRPRRGLLAGCAVAVGLFCTCQLCCTEHEGPWSRQKRDPWCDGCDGCDCCDSCGDGCCCCPCDGC